MASENTVKLTFAGDATSLDRAFDQVGKGAKEMAQDVDKASRETRNLGDSLESTTKTSRSGKDVLDGLNDSLGAMGVTLPGPIGQISTFAGGVADLADGMGGLLAPALAKAKVGFRGLNATMRANPILAVVTVLALLGAGLVVLYKKSETFRKIVNGAFNGVKKYAEIMAEVWKGVFQAMGDSIDWLAGKAQWLWDHSPLKQIINGANKVAGLAGGVGSKLGGLNPFANGGPVSGGTPILVGERGPEVFVPSGHGNIVKNGAGGSGGSMQVQIVLQQDGERLMDFMKKKVRTAGGGNVQVAFR